MTSLNKQNIGAIGKYIATYVPQYASMHIIYIHSKLTCIHISMLLKQDAWEADILKNNCMV